MESMTSRERMLAALSCQEVDYIPCSFMIFDALRMGCSSYEEFIRRETAMGLDAVVTLPPRPPIVKNDYYDLHCLPVNYHPEVRIVEKTIPAEEGNHPLMVKEYITPAGTLRAEVWKTADWKWGDHIPFLDDYIVPRSRKYLVSDAKDLPALRYLLVPPTQAEIEQFGEDAKAAIQLAREHQLLVSNGWGVGADLIGWICGLVNLIYDVYDKAAYIQELLEIIYQWNKTRMEVILETGIDLYIKRAWYENTDYWSPTNWRKYLLPILKKETDLCHQAGVKFAYIITSACMPLLDSIAEAGVDCIIGVDPADWDLAAAKEKLKHQVCLWGGVTGHLTVEQGNEEDIRAAVRNAIAELSPGYGFILSPVDNIRYDAPDREKALKNVEIFIDEWKKRR